jgi:hypothetical protein
MRKGWDDALDFQNQLRYAMRTEEWGQELAYWGTGQSRGVNYQEWPTEGNRPVGEREMKFIAAMACATAVGFAPEDYTEPGTRAFEYTSKNMPGEMEIPPMWVDNGVIDLVEYAAETFRPEALYATDLIIPNAFCVFERTMFANDIEGREISFRAASWSHFVDPADDDRRGIILALWRHMNDEDAYSRNSPLRYHRRVGGSPLRLMQTAMFPWGEARAMEDVANHKLFAQLQVLWKMAKQQITIQSERQVSRPTWRSKQNWRQIKTVQVLTLRRAKVVHEGETGEAHYSHRFPVHGHWRNQWYASEKVHRQIWINGYVKGPEDKPFVAKRQAVEFIR